VTREALKGRESGRALILMDIMAEPLAVVSQAPFVKVMEPRPIFFFYFFFF